MAKYLIEIEDVEDRDDWEDGEAGRCRISLVGENESGQITPASSAVVTVLEALGIEADDMTLLNSKVDTSRPN